MVGDGLPTVSMQGLSIDYIGEYIIYGLSIRDMVRKGWGGGGSGLSMVSRVSL